MARLESRLEPEPGDLTPLIGAQTDIAPLGRDVQRPAHERTATEDTDVTDWERVAAMSEFRQLVAAKLRFIVPATIFFIVYYFALPVLVGYAPKFMDTPVIGPVNIAYLFALSQFVVAWILAYLYVRQAVHFDRMARDIIARLRDIRGRK